MKKIMLVVLAVLMLTFAAVSAQETQTVTEINWEDVAEIAAEVDSEAQFFLIGETGMAMWIPSVFHDVELTQEDVDAGMVAFLSTEDADAFCTSGCFSPDHWHILQGLHFWGRSKAICCPERSPDL